ncbi:MAG: hypothetical protein IJV89_08165 [Lentisphaeria bacterium]|nr:hypothetical protein [Lentisphaeria bacterium]
MAQFPLLMNGTEVCTLEDLKKNFNPVELVVYRKRFAAWLKGWDYDNEAVEVKTLDQNLTDDQWLKAICGIIGISDQEFEAGLNKINEIKKEEQEKAEKKLAEEQQRKLKIEQKKKFDPTPENINITKICFQKSPFSEAVETIFTCEKGILVKTISDFLYFSSDGKSFSSVKVNAWSTHHYTHFSCLNGYLLFLDRNVFYFSENGSDWQSFNFKSVLPAGTEMQNFTYFTIVPFDGIVYDDCRQHFVIFYHSRAGKHYRATAEFLSGPWHDQKEISSLPQCQYIDFVLGKYIGGSYMHDGLSIDYYSDDGLIWNPINESDQKWLDDIEVEEGNRLIHVDYCDREDDTKRFLFKYYLNSWRKNVFFIAEGIFIKAWRKGYEKKSVSTICDFQLKRIACFKDKLLIFGENNEFATSEIHMGEAKTSDSQERLSPEVQIQISYGNYIDVPIKLEKYSIFSTTSAFIVKSGCDCFLSKDGKEFENISSLFNCCEWISCINDFFVLYEKSKIKISKDGLKWNIVNIELITKQAYQSHFYLYDIFYVDSKYIAIWRNENTTWYCFSVSNSFDGYWEEIGSVESYTPIETISYYSGIYFAQSENDTFYSEDLKKWSKVWDSPLNIVSSLQQRLPLGVQFKEKGGHYTISTAENKLTVFLFGREFSLSWDKTHIFTKNYSDQRKIYLASTSFPIHSVFYCNETLWISGNKGELASGKIIFKED